MNSGSLITMSLILVGLAVFLKGDTFMTRGERNNNPGNIRKNGIAWDGAINGDDNAFITFASSFFGIRALAKILITYYKKYGLNTIAGIINRYAPSSENFTANYINFVSGYLNVGKHQMLNLSDNDVLAGLIKAIIKFENGRNIYDTDKINTAIEAARN